MPKTTIDKAFTYHPPRPGQPLQYESLRQQARQLAESIVHNVPDSEERTQSLCRLREAIMWANAGIAIHGPPWDGFANRPAQDPPATPGKAISHTGNSA